MDIGMLWYCDDPKRTLEQKVAEAAAFYRAKHGQAPTHCYVNPALLPAGPTAAAGLQVRPLRTVIANHFWLGVETAP